MGIRRPQPRSHWPAHEVGKVSQDSDATRDARSRKSLDADQASEGFGSTGRPRSPEEIAAVSRIGICPVCGTKFDPSAYQILVSALGRDPFDRIECADIALADRRRAQSELL